MKKLSIVTICYNEPNLDCTCQSIVNQTWQDFEWIVIDGGSNKETLDVFEKYKYRIDKFISEPDNGIYNACNKGIKLATGEYIHFLNAGDCYFNNNVLQNVFSQSQYNEDVLYGELEFVNYKKNKNIISEQPKIDKYYLINNCILTPASFIKLDLFYKYGLFNENYKIVSDYEKWVIFFKNNVLFKHLNVVIAKFDTTGISSNKKYQKLHMEERNDVVKKYFTKDEINKALSLITMKYSFIENIFSIKNHPNKKHKVITILGIHIKIRRKFNA